MNNINISGNTINGGVIIADTVNGVPQTPTLSNLSATKASAVLTERRFTVPVNVNEVVASGSIEVKIEHTEAETYAIASASASIIDAIECNVDGNQVTIGMKPGIYPSVQPIKLTLYLKTCQALTAIGSGNISMKGMVSPTFNFKQSGSGDVTIAGHFDKITANMFGSGDTSMNLANSQNIAVGIVGSGDFDIAGKTNTFVVSSSGTGDIEAKQLIADTVNVMVNGSGNVKVYASEKVDAITGGSGGISIYGHPAVQRCHTGSGRIKFA